MCFSSDAYEANDMTLRAENVTDGGIVALAYQSEPDPFLWAITGDGGFGLPTGQTRLRHGLSDDTRHV